MIPLLSTQEITKSFGAKKLFENLSFGVFSEERVAVIGPNGAGKSTLLKILAGIEKPDQGICAIRKSARAVYLPQISEFHDDISIQKYLDQVLGPLVEDEFERMQRVGIILSLGGVSDPEMHITSLSGGWKKRLALLSGLIQEPDLLLLDEPTNHLDIDGILWLEEILKNHKKEMATVFVSHDRYFLENVSTRVVELNSRYPEGMLSIEGKYSDFLEKREEYLKTVASYQHSLANRVRREIEWLRRGAKARTTKSSARIKEAHGMIEELGDLKSRAKEAKVQLDFVASERATKKLITVKNISKKLGGRTLFHHLSFTLSAGKKLGLVGDNGSGKSTLLKILSNDFLPDEGTVEWADHLKLVFFEQNRKTLNLEETLGKSLCPEGDSVMYRGKLTHVASYARMFLFRPEQMNLRVKYLSGGEQARLLMAQMMLKPADVLFLDEPTNDLDIESLEVLEESLQDFTGTVILVSHDRAFLDRVCDQVLAIEPEESGGAQFFADLNQWLEFKKDWEKKQKALQKKQGSTSEPLLARRRLTYNEKREWDQMEEKILQAEEALEIWKLQVEDPSIQAETLKLKEAFDEMTRAQQLVDRLYQRWTVLEAINKENK